MRYAIITHCNFVLLCTVDSRYSGSLKYGHLNIIIYRPFGLARNASYLCLLHKTHPEERHTRYSVYRPVLAVPNKVFNVILYVYYGRFGCSLANKIGLHLNREQNDSLSYIILEARTAKVVIRLEVRSFLSRGYFLSCSYLAIPAKLHGPKGDKINESLYTKATESENSDLQLATH